MKLIIPVNTARTARLAPHRFGQVGNLIVVEDASMRLDLHLTDAQLYALAVPALRRLTQKAHQQEDE